MINNLFILAPSGEVLIEKQWRGQVKRTVCDTFLEQVTTQTKKKAFIILLGGQVWNQGSLPHYPHAQILSDPHVSLRPLFALDLSEGHCLNANIFFPFFSPLLKRIKNSF